MNSTTPTISIIFRRLVLTTFILLTTSAVGSVDFTKEPACNTLTPFSQGGPAPQNSNLVVVRYLGAGNQEINHRDNIFLLNAYYDRQPPGRPLGFDRTDVENATAIFVDHAHWDHFADVPYVAKKTGAPIIGAAITTETARKYGIPENQVKTFTGKGGESIPYNGVTVEPVLANHHDNSTALQDIVRIGSESRRALLTAAGMKPQPTAEEYLQLPGSMDPNIYAEGTLGFVFTFSNGYTIYFRDATGSPTEYEKALADRIGSPDIGIFAYSNPIPDEAVNIIMPFIKTFKPKVFIPTHHDDVGGHRFETPVEPLFQAIRHEFPDIRKISPLYLTPICIDISDGSIFVGE